MSNTLKANAYQVLGLDLTASEKDILKRSKEILIRLKADEPKEYDFDIGLFDDFRNEDSVKEAVQKLQLPKKQIMEFFFWFYIYDDTDKKALKHIKDKDYQSAIEIWGEDYKEDTVNSFNHKKNLALFLTYLLSIEDNEDCVEKSISLWKSIFDSEKYWSSFKKVYSLYNEQSLDDTKLTKLKTDTISYLGDIYTEFYEKYKNNIYIEKFQETFSANSNKIQNKILDPAFEKINDAVEELENMKISKDSKFDDKEKTLLKNLINLIQTELNNLISLGLYKNSQTLIMRDRIARVIREISIDIHNEPINEKEMALKLTEIALQIGGTISTSTLLEQDHNAISQFIEDDNNNPLNRCWFCQDLLKNQDSSYIQDMYKVTNTEQTFSGKRIHYQKYKILIPRCNQCLNFHNKNEKKYSKIGFSIGVTVGIIISLFNSSEFWGFIIITGVSTIISYLIFNTIGNSKGTDKIKSINYTSEFQLYKDMIKDGWSAGDQPSS